MTNGFALNHDKNLQIYFFCVKRQAKNDFLKDVESTVVAAHFINTAYVTRGLVMEEYLMIILG